MKILTDNDRMPFGKHRGELMKAVPASYFFWLWTEAGFEHKTATDPVADYINRNIKTLRQDWPDGIWDQTDREEAV
jgi:hypothetical protein